MEGGESILEAIYEADELEDVNDDIDMLDVEEGECVDVDPQLELGQASGGTSEVVNQELPVRNPRRKKNKKRNKKKKNGAPEVTDINRFVIDTCRRLKERKSYLVWTAVGILGVSALSDLVKEVHAIQACGGQMTADGKRHRVGGGVLWSILKTREPNAYKEIMKRGREFEKQFKQPMERSGRSLSQETTPAAIDQTTTTSTGPHPMPQVQDKLEQPSAHAKRVPVHSRIRVPISYDDGLLEDDHTDGSEKHDST